MAHSQARIEVCEICTLSSQKELELELLHFKKVVLKEVWSVQIQNKIISMGCANTEMGKDSFKNDCLIKEDFWLKLNFIHRKAGNGYKNSH